MAAKAERNGKQSLVAKFAANYHIEGDRLLATLRATAFRQKKGEVSNEQMVALLVVADQYELNPFTREIYAFPDKNNGIVPVVGVDGWSRIINSHPDFDGMDFVYADELVESDEHKPCPEWIECVMYRKDRAHPVRVKEYFDECYRPPFTFDDGGKSNGPWQTHTKRFLRHKSMIQCARIAFGFVGIFDPDEAERFNDYIDVTPEPTGKPKTSEPKAIESKPLDPMPTMTLVTEGQVAVLRKHLERAGLDEAALCQEFEVADVSGLPFDRANDAIEWIAKAPRDG